MLLMGVTKNTYQWKNVQSWYKSRSQSAYQYLTLIEYLCHGGIQQRMTCQENRGGLSCHGCPHGNAALTMAIWHTPGGFSPQQALSSMPNTADRRTSHFSRRKILLQEKSDPWKLFVKFSRVGDKCGFSNIWITTCLESLKQVIFQALPVKK